MKIKPKLRFPEFDGEWEEKQLSAILEIGIGKSKVQSNESGKYNILGSTGIIGKSHTYDYEGDFILTARVGHYAGKLYKHAGKVNISDNTIYLFNFINKNFIYESLNAFKLEKLVFGSGQPLIKASDLKKLKIRVPVSKEQKKIGGFFSKLDQQIELEEQKLSLLEEQKKGYIQQIFSQELRFKDENDIDYPEWEDKRFEELFDFHNNLRKPIRESVRVKGNYRYYGATGVIDFVNDYIFDGEYILIGEDGANIISRSAPLVYLAKGKFWVNNHAHILTPKNGYIYYWFLVADNVNYIKYNTGTAQPKLNVQNLKNINVNITSSISEQEKIGGFFKNFYKLIEKQNQKIDGLKERKQGLLQKMFV